MPEITPQEMINMIKDGSILGITTITHYKSGNNAASPVTKEFLRFKRKGRNNALYIEYMLTNPNTNDYKEPKLFEYPVEEFLNSLYDCVNGIEEDLERIEMFIPKSTWEV